MKHALMVYANCLRMLQMRRRAVVSTVQNDVVVPLFSKVIKDTTKNRIRIVKKIGIYEETPTSFLSKKLEAFSFYTGDEEPVKVIVSIEDL